jgi:ketosteroid isomerase-like protein
MKVVVAMGMLVLSGAMAFAQTNVVPASVNPTEAITRLREGLIDSFNKGDMDRLLTHLGTNVVVTWQDGEVIQGREGVRQYYNKMLKGDRPMFREVTIKPEVLGRNLYGDWAVSWGKMNDDFKLTDGTDLPLNSTFTATIARNGDEWVLTAFHTSVNAFENPVMRLALKKMGRIAVWGGTAGGVVLGLLLAKLFRRRKNDPV